MNPQENSIITELVEESTDQMPNLEGAFEGQKKGLMAYVRTLVMLFVLSGQALLPGCINPPREKTKVHMESDKEHPEIDRKKIRLHSEQYGTVYVWHPAYKGDLDGVAIYFHGYNKDSLTKKICSKARKLFRKITICHTVRMDIDKYWETGQLEDQFRTSGAKRLFVVPQSARDDKEKKQTDVAGLLSFVQKETGINIANKNITIMAHSSGGNTVPYWLDDPRVNNTVVLDGIYSKTLQQKLSTWLGMQGNRLIIVSSARKGSRPAHKKFVLDYIKKNDSVSAFMTSKIPNEPDSKMCGARLVYGVSNNSHAGLVQSKEIIPSAFHFIGKCEGQK